MSELSPNQSLLSERGITDEALATALLICEPGISLAEIARRLNLSRGKLYRNAQFMTAWRTYRLPDSDLRPHRGMIDENGHLDAFGERSDNF